MKTIEKWFKSVKEEHVREALLKNMNATARNTKRDSLADALRQGFIWSSSPQGLDYWSAWFEVFRSDQYLKK